jgi:hypothetical protein
MIRKNRIRKTVQTKKTRVPPKLKKDSKIKMIKRLILFNWIHHY